MTYKIISIHEKTRAPITWVTFDYPESDPWRVRSFINYLLKSSANPDQFILYEVDSHKGYQLTKVKDTVFKKLGGLIDE